MADPLLVSASAMFHTRDDDKSDDSFLSIGLILPDGTVAASVARISGRFPDDHDNGPFCLTVHEPTKRSELKNSAAALHMETSSSDTWKFDWSLVLAFDDGSQHTGTWSDLLSNSKKDGAYGLNITAVAAPAHRFGGFPKGKIKATLAGEWSGRLL